MVSASQKLKKVVVWGTFDLLHEGHIKFLQDAKSIGDQLIVIVIPDTIVIENKGRMPFDPQDKRKKKIEDTNIASAVFIDSLSEGLRSVKKIKPDVFCFGYDQFSEWEEKLSDKLREYNPYIKFKRLHEHSNGIHTSNIIKNTEMTSGP